MIFLDAFLEVIGSIVSIDIFIIFVASAVISALCIIFTNFVKGV